MHRHEWPQPRDEVRRQAEHLVEFVDAVERRVLGADGLKTGQYFAPVTNFIFPENVVPGDPAVPYDFWALRFLVGGEGPGTGPLIPQPW